MTPESTFFERRTNKSKLNKYSTPISMTESLMSREKFDGIVYEPSCGDGAMIDVIKK